MAATTLAAEALVEAKKKNILGLFGNSKMSITQERKAAFHQFFAINAPKIRVKFLKKIVFCRIETDDMTTKRLALIKVNQFGGV